MRILITGANGFIAREIIAKLSMRGHTIIACVHNKILENIPYSSYFKVDFKQATQGEYWLPHLQNIDVVINCVGVFQTIKEKTMWDIHYQAPKALFQACTRSKVKKIIQLSALGVDKVKVPYAMSKQALDEYLQSLDIASTIIRPSLVYGKGSYGGSSLFRGLVGFPFIIPLPGRAEQLQQPIHMDDLTEIIEKSLTLSGKQIICAVGSEKLSIKDVLMKLRQWLGFKKAIAISIPDLFIQWGAKVGNFIPNSPLSETGIKMMTVDNIATESEEKILLETYHFKPKSFTAGLMSMVSSVQDRWHARLYFLRPLLRLSLAFIWIYSGVVSLVNHSGSQILMNQAHLPIKVQPLFLYALSAIDILLGILTLCNYRILFVGLLQIILIVGFTLCISFLIPHLWLHPFGPLAKNIPIIIATFMMLALESER